MHKTCVILREGRLKLWLIFPALCHYGVRPLCVCVFLSQVSADPSSSWHGHTANLHSQLGKFPRTHSASLSLEASWTPPAYFTKKSHCRFCQPQSQIELGFGDQKDICMWVSLVARLGYCSTHGLMNVTGRTLSSPNRPLSMTSGGTLNSNCSPGTGCPPWHQRPFVKNSGGL